MFLAAVLAKKYAHASSDVIAVLAGLDRIDAVMTDFVAVLDSVAGQAVDRKFVCAGRYFVFTSRRIPADVGVRQMLSGRKRSMSCSQ